MNTEIDWIFRLLLAAVCGGLIGYERSRQQKSAGIRTHMLVIVGAALVMLVSKYGFQDILSARNIVLDPSRIAAQIVSGISFIGAGTILIHRTQISGLTTAAGVWVTAAIGMSIGAGMYLIGISATIFIIIIQFVFHDDSILNMIIRNSHIRLQIEIDSNSFSKSVLEGALTNNGVNKTSLRVTSADNQTINLQIDGLTRNKNDRNEIILSLCEIEGVNKVQLDSSYN